jgi:uncharacterized protein YyaL (SSP411 family)
MSNRLAAESSPYLRQHSENPVDWYPWGTEALERARRENVPVFLSVGYSACHWCHVMAHESFEDSETAEFLNAHFVCVKVDREERPDLDALYMRAVHVMTGRGGWPLSVFLMPDLKPVYGGTYFPPEPLHGMPSFRQVLAGVSRAFREDPQGVGASAERVRDAVAASFAPPRVHGHADPEEAVDRTLDALLRRYDPHAGGFGSGPKFPQPPLLEFMLLEGLRRNSQGLEDKVRFTLGAMERGGVRDQVGGGFHRYSVDGVWRVPHFEKMLYDNAQLASLYALAHRAFGDHDLLRVSREVLDDLVRTLSLPGGGFAAALDADSEGEEGRYYRWTPAQLADVLKDETEFFRRVFPVGEGRDEVEATTLWRTQDLPGGAAAFGMAQEEIRKRIAGCLDLLRHARERRVAPGLDTKRLTDWNALAAKAFFDAHRAGAGPGYLEKGSETLECLWGIAWSGGILHHIADGKSRVSGFLADYAYLAEAHWAAYIATADPGHLRRCETLLRASLKRFRDPGSGFIFETPAAGSDGIPVPLRDDGDGVLPSPLAILTRTLWNWERLEGGGWAREAIDEIVSLETGAALSEPGSRPLLAGIALWRSLPGTEVVVASPSVGEPFDTLWYSASIPAHPGLLALPFLPHTHQGPGTGPTGLFAGRAAPGAAAAYLCTGGTCDPPTAAPGVLERRLRDTLLAPKRD